MSDLGDYERLTEEGKRTYWRNREFGANTTVPAPVKDAAPDPKRDPDLLQAELQRVYAANATNARLLDEARTELDRLQAPKDAPTLRERALRLGKWLSMGMHDHYDEFGYDLRALIDAALAAATPQRERPEDENVQR